jgi:hypothetical protein
MGDHRRTGWYWLGGIVAGVGGAIFAGWYIAVSSGTTKRPVLSAPFFVGVAIVAVGLAILFATMAGRLPRRARPVAKKSKPKKQKSPSLTQPSLPARFQVQVSGYGEGSKAMEVQGGFVDLTGSRFTNNDLGLHVTNPSSTKVHAPHTTFEGNTRGVVVGSDVGIEILKAEYGAGDIWIDVTEAARRQILNGRFDALVTNALYGYHLPGIGKSLRVECRWHGKDMPIQAFDESTQAVLPRPGW